MAWEATIEPEGAKIKIKTTGPTGSEEISDSISQEELQELSVDTGNTKVPLEELFKSGVTKIEASSRSEGQFLVERDNIDEPAPPLIDICNIEQEQRLQYYERLMQSHDSQPATMRKLIYHHSPLTKGELGDLMEERGYNRNSGGFGESLRVLRNVTEEVEMKGRGPSAQLQWIGKE